MRKSKVPEFPTVAAVAAELRAINREVECGEPDGYGDYEGCDVRLQVYEDGVWAVRWGLSDYDLDHRGYWGASFVPGGNKRFNSTETAKFLIDECRDHYYQSR